MRGSRQGFLRVSENNPIERDLREIGAKVATRRDYAIRVRVRVSAYRRVIGIGVGEGTESAPCHPKGERQSRVELSSCGARGAKVRNSGACSPYKPRPAKDRLPPKAALRSESSEGPVWGSSSPITIGP